MDDRLTPRGSATGEPDQPPNQPLNQEPGTAAPETAQHPPHEAELAREERGNAGPGEVGGFGQGA